MREAKAAAIPDAWEAAYLRFETQDEEVRKFARRLLGLGARDWPKDARIVELFCGRGNGLLALRQLGFQRVNGVDLSPRLLDVYRGPGHRIVGDCRAIPLTASSHDVAIVQGGLHHLPDLLPDLRHVVLEVRRVLKPGGLFVVVEPWLTPFLELVHRVGCSAPIRRVWPKMDALATMIEHERDTYERWLQQPGAIAEILAAGFVPVVTRKSLGKWYFVGRVSDQLKQGNAS